MTAQERRLLSLKSEVLADLAVIRKIVDEVEDARQNLSLAKEPDLVTVMGLAALVHHFYSATEAAFQRIIRYFDGGLPTGESWRRELLVKAATEVPGLRPAIISQDLRKRLDDYRRFRHLFRNVYEADVDWNKLVPLLNELTATFHALENQLRGFAEFISTVATQKLESSD